MLHIDLSHTQAQVFYHVFITLGVLLPFVFAWWAGRKKGFHNPTWLTTLAFIVGLSIIGARFGAFTGAEWLSLFQAGTWHRETPKTVVGSIVFAILGYQFLKRFFHLPATAADVFILGLPLGGAVGRIACLMAGCCYGNPSDSAWAITFGQNSSAFVAQNAAGLLGADAQHSLPLAPVQLYLILGNFAIFALCFVFRKRFKAGNLAYILLILMAINRFSSEIFRDSLTNRGETGQIFLGLKLVQWFCIGLAVTSVFLWKKNKQKGFGLSSNFQAQALPKLLVILIPMTFLLWIFRGRLGIMETLCYVLICLPALVSVFYAIVQQEWAYWKKIPSIALMSGLFLFQVQIQADSLGQPTKLGVEAASQKEHWMEFGLGYGAALYRDYDATTTGSGCDSRTTVNRDRNIVSKMSGFETVYHTLNGHQHSSVGFRLGLGDAHTLSGFPLNSGKFSVGGIFGTLDGKGISATYGLNFLSDNALEVLGTKFGTGRAQLTGGVRFGRRDVFFMDLQFRERQQFLYYPSPRFTIGLLNWGFNDRYGRNRLRFGFASLGREAAFVPFASGSAALFKQQMSLEFGAYTVGEFQYAVSFGLHYKLR